MAFHNEPSERERFVCYTWLKFLVGVRQPPLNPDGLVGVTKNAARRLSNMTSSGITLLEKVINWLAEMYASVCVSKINFKNFPTIPHTSPAKESRPKEEHSKSGSCRFLGLVRSDQATLPKGEEVKDQTIYLIYRHEYLTLHKWPHQPATNRPSWSGILVQVGFLASDLSLSEDVDTLAF